MDGLIRTLTIGFEAKKTDVISRVNGYGIVNDVFSADDLIKHVSFVKSKVLGRKNSKSSYRIAIRFTIKRRSYWVLVDENWQGDIIAQLYIPSKNIFKEITSKDYLEISSQIKQFHIDIQSFTDKIVPEGYIKATKGDIRWVK